MKKICLMILCSLFCITNKVYPQIPDTIDFKFIPYDLKGIYDTSKYCSDLIVSKDNNIIYKEECLDYRITSINTDDLEGKGNKFIFIETYSGGAHCCTYLLAAKITEDKFIFTDSIWWGNSGYEIKDINNDGEKEVIGYNDIFAYAFTNFAQSAFPIAIYKFKDGKFIFANKQFENKVLEHIKELKADLKQYTTSGFDCPANVNDDTFNTDAGAVKALLAPIVADYQSIGKTNEGYDLINKVYKCPDSDKFIKTLKNEYKLK
ncbi:MAG: hypothetical protein ABSF32_05065 [Ignavibacteria bacterium]